MMPSTLYRLKGHRDQSAVGMAIPRHEVSGSNLQVMFGGDEAWNEWLKKRAIVEALGRARAKSAVPQLVPLVSAQCRSHSSLKFLGPRWSER